METCDLQKVATFDKKIATCDLLDGSFPGFQAIPGLQLNLKKFYFYVPRTVITAPSGWACRSSTPKQMLSGAEKDEARQVGNGSS